MKAVHVYNALVILLTMSGCVEKFTPDIEEVQYIPVVEGLITDQPEIYTIRLYWSVPLGETKVIPLGRCVVEVHDDQGNIYPFTETSIPGTYVSDSATFRGIIGLRYTLRINTNEAVPRGHLYESLPVELKAVPPIDSLYYEKVAVTGAMADGIKKEGIRIFLNTFDPTGECRYYRWDYTETWKFEIPYQARHGICWVTKKSTSVNIKNIMTLSDSRIVCQPVLLITNETDRLSRRYTIMVNQYSLSEEEFAYWDRIRSISYEAGGLYDVVPYSISGNLFCVDNPGEGILGYFSVSARTSRRIYINSMFGLSFSFFRECARDPKLKADDPRCTDCTWRGTLNPPDFWEDY